MSCYLLGKAQISHVSGWFFARFVLAFARLKSAKKHAGVFCSANDLDFELTETWGESEKDSKGEVLLMRLRSMYLEVVLFFLQARFQTLAGFWISSLWIPGCRILQLQSPVCHESVQCMTSGKEREPGKTTETFEKSETEANGTEISRISFQKFQRLFRAVARFFVTGVIMASAEGTRLVVRGSGSSLRKLLNLEASKRYFQHLSWDVSPRNRPRIWKWQTIVIHYNQNNWV